MAQLSENCQDKALYAGFKRVVMLIDKGEEMAHWSNVNIKDEPTYRNKCSIHYTAVYTRTMRQ